jgi:hypothetical protein
MKVIDATLRFGRAVGLSLLFIALHVQPAAAAPSNEQRERARALMDLGDARFEAKNYASALEQYRAADEIMNVPTTGIEVGRTLERLGRLLEAREVLRRVSEFPQRADEPRPFASARQRADRLLGDIAPRIPRVTLQVTGLPEGTTPTISWDGERIDDARIGGYLEANPGEHHVVGTAPGFPEVKRDVRLAEGQALQVVLAFGNAPAAGPVSVAAPERSHAPLPAVAKASKPVLLWASLGVAAAGMAVGSATGVYSLSRTKGAKQHCDGNTCTPEARRDIDGAKTFANISNVAFGVGVVALGVGAWQFLSHRTPKNTGKDAKIAGLEAQVGFGSVAVTGAF